MTIHILELWGKKRVRFRQNWHPLLLLASFIPFSALQMILLCSSEIGKYLHNLSEIKRLRVQLLFADYTMPMRIKQTCSFSSNNSLRGYVRVCMIMLIAWLLKSKSTTPLCLHAIACEAVNKSKCGSPLCDQRGLLYLGSAATRHNNNPVTCHWGSPGKQGFPLSQEWSTRWHSHGYEQL